MTWILENSTSEVWESSFLARLWERKNGPFCSGLMWLLQAGTGQIAGEWIVMAGNLISWTALNGTAMLGAAVRSKKLEMQSVSFLVRIIHLSVLSWFRLDTAGFGI